MSVGRCHSAFQHYEMFHGHGACHGGGNNYGSIFNINYSCNGGHGNFWSGLGAGLGYGLGGWLMGGLNMLGGWLGFGGMGFGGGWGMGMPMFGWGGGATTNNVTSNNTGRVRTRTIEKTDSEYSAINDAREALQKLQQKESITDDELNELTEKINSLKADDGINDDDNEEQIRLLKIDLDTLRDKVGITGVVPKTEVSKIDEVTDINGLIGTLPEDGFEGLSDEDKKKFEEKLIELLKTVGISLKIELLNNSKLHGLEAVIKQSFYESGYENYDGSSELKDGDVVKAHDTSNMTRDTESDGQLSSITQAENGNYPEIIVIHDKKDITYKYKETNDGEYIYVSDQDKQEYVLQKYEDKYYLQQYAYHKGYSIKDWSPES